jgi:hypothetical protein
MIVHNFTVKYLDVSFGYFEDFTEFTDDVFNFA